MSVQDLVRLEDHPTPWWSRYALTHPMVVFRTVQQHSLRSGRWGDGRTVLMGWALLLLVLGSLWYLAIDPTRSLHEDHPWIDAIALTLVMVPVAGFATLNAYQNRMEALHRHRPRAFLKIAETFERQREGQVLRQAVASVERTTPNTTPAPRRRL